MGNLHRLRPVALALLLSFLMSSCLVTRRVITRGHKRVNGTSPALRVATRDELNAIIARTYNSIQSFQATSVNLTPSRGSVYEGSVTDYKDFTGYIFFSKPDKIRIAAYLPVVHTRAFDMVSDGTNFRFLLENKSLFVEGLNAAPPKSQNKMENMRPEAFLSSMLIRPVDPASEFVILKDETDEENALYRLEFISKAADGTLLPGREVWFDRLDLSIVRQKLFDDKGLTVSDTSYSKWQQYNGVSFPAHIDINRPRDGYGVAIDVVKMVMNKDITADKFLLTQPEGFKLQVIN